MATAPAPHHHDRPGGRRRAAAVAGVAVLVALGAAGCGTGSSTSSTPTTTAAPATSGTSGGGAAAPATPGTSGGGAAATTTVPPTTAPSVAPTTTTPSTGASAAGSQCASADLSVAIGSPSGSAGHVGYLLTLTNTGSGTCALQGYPGVSYVTGSSGTQVGAPAVRISTTAPAVSLPPGARAQVAVQETDPLNYPSSICRLTAVRGLRVYPPGQTAALFVAQAAKACANPALTQLQTYPVEPAGAASI